MAGWQHPTGKATAVSQFSDVMPRDKSTIMISRRLLNDPGNRWNTFGRLGVNYRSLVVLEGDLA